MAGLNLTGQPLIDRPDFAQLLADGVFGAYGEQAESMHRRGYCLLDLAGPAFDQLAGQIRTSLEPAFDLEAWREGRAHNLRLQDGWRQCEAVRQLALAAPVLELLATLYGREPFCFQTLNFPVGSEQHFHSDAVHFHSYPHGFMVGVWVALEPITAEVGPLEYFPGSHRLPYLSAEQLELSPEQVEREEHPQLLFEPRWREAVQQQGWEPQLFLPRQGQALVWHANLLHGGRAQPQRLGTRWSQVSHYFFADCLYTTPLRSFAAAQGGPWLRNPLDVATARERLEPRQFAALAA